MNVQYQLRGRFTVTIISGDREDTTDWSPNLILNCGKDGVMAGLYTLCNASSYCAIGTGSSTPTAEQTSLDGEVKRSNTYKTSGTGNCQTIIGYTGTEQTVTLRRGYLFPVEIVDTPVPYTELGWANGATGNLFSRAIPAQPIGLKAGQQLLIVYDLIVTMTPAKETAGTLIIDGWSNPTGIMSISSQGIGHVGSNGIGDTVKRAYEPGSTVYGYVRTGIIAHPAFNAYRVGGTNLCNTAAGTWSTYTPGTFSRSISFPYTNPSTGDSDAITGLAWGTSNSELSTVFAFDTVRAKSNLYKVKPNGYNISIGTG
jgi:hypothetical protein